MLEHVRRLFWRLGATDMLVGHGWGLRESWSYAVALSSGPCDFFAENYSPRDAVLEDRSYGD